MSQVGFTPIQLYRSSTAAAVPTAGNLVAGELAINTTDEKLYFENASGVVKLLASSAAAGGTFTTVTATTVVNGLGLVGTPAYTFTGDLNTGMWSPAADTLAFSTAGSERLRIDSSGRLLVGIGSPIGSSTVPVQSPGGFISANDAAGLRLLNSAQNGGGSVFANTGSNGGISIGSDAGPMLFVSTTERMRITSAGLVGIGNTAPNTTLDVSGSITSRSGSVIADTLTNYGANLVLNAAGSLDTIFQTNGTERMRLTTGGNVGIGTSAPFVKLQVVGGSILSDTSVQVLKDGSDSIAGGPFFLLRNAANTQSWITQLGASNTYDFWNFDTSWSRRVTFTAAGAVGIGTSAPGAKLTVTSTSSTALLIESAGLPEAYNPATFSSKNAYMASGVQENWNAGSSASTVAGYLVDITAYNGVNATDVYFGAAAGPSVTGGPANFVFGRRTGIQAWAETMRIDSTGNVGIGTTAPTTGSMSNVAILNAGMFTTFRGAVTAANNTATTIAVASSAVNATYIVCCGIASADPVNFSAVAIVSGDLGVYRTTTLQTANLMAISVSGTNIRATQNAGGAATVAFSITRIS